MIKIAKLFYVSSTERVWSQVQITGGHKDSRIYI